MNEPIVTDWIGAFGTLLGVPAIIVGILNLFKKNKELERQLLALDKMAVSQDDAVKKMSDQILELTRQTSEFQYQTLHMKEANEIASKHLEMLNLQFVQETSTKEKELEYQRLDRLNKIKPHFTFSDALSQPNMFKVVLLNKGFVAKGVLLVNIGNDFAIFNPISDQDVEQNQKLTITGYADITKTFYNSNQLAFEFQLEYLDEDGNKYAQIINRKNNNFAVSNPRLLIGQAESKDSQNDEG